MNTLFFPGSFQFCCHSRNVGLKYSSNKCDGEKLKYNFKGLIQRYLKIFVRILGGGDCINIFVYINSEYFYIIYHVLSNKE